MTTIKTLAGLLLLTLCAVVCVYSAVGVNVLELMR